MEKSGSFNFSNNERIKKKKDFEKIYKDGKRIRSKYYNCLYLKNDLNNNRLGIIVRKNIGKAVERNYEKRVIREAFRTNKHILNNNYDILITVVKKETVYIEKYKDIEAVLKRIREDE